MSGKIKHEVNTARTHLESTLQSLVEKKDDSFESTESDDEPDMSLPLSVYVVRSTGSPVTSPAKRGSSRSKKRKRKDDVFEYASTSGYTHSHTCVMKLFDRSVDLAEFTETTPLYPIARAWINNTPPSTEEAQDVTTDESKEQEDPAHPNVYSLPKPVKVKVQYGYDQLDQRIPPLLPCNDTPLDIHADPDQGPPPEELLLRHMDRWKQIRNTWCNAARLNELRFSYSMNILKDMFDRTMQEQPFDG